MPSNHTGQWKPEVDGIKIKMIVVTCTWQFEPNTRSEKVNQGRMGIGW